MKRSFLIGATVLSVAIGGALAAFWWLQRPESSGNGPIYGGYGGYGSDTITFKDDVASNASITSDQLALEFLDRQGNIVRLGDFLGQKHVVLVFLRGLTKVPGGLCPTCSAQTARLLANYDEFVKRNTEVVIVFPGAKLHLDEFVRKVQAQGQKASVPFPVLLDKDLQAVDRLGIRDDMAKPSTFILDKDGQVRFAYVGATTADRPSLKAIFGQLDTLIASAD